jgi:hypothetical protein
MSGRLLAAIAVMVVPATADAEVWMAKGSGALACDDRQTLIDLDASPTPLKSTDELPKGCIRLYSGERVLEDPQMGEGFTKYLRVEHEDGAKLFVRASDFVSDPGIGTPSEDRANR